MFTMPHPLDHLRIILVEPAGALNVGSVARVMKNWGLRQLVLVNPQCDVDSGEARQMAVHATDLLESAQQVKTLPDALVGCQRAIATTGVDRTTLNVCLEHPKTALPWLLEAPHEQAALIFGREDRGLTKAELNYAQRFIRIPTSPDYTSMNLAQAVAICCYELAELAQATSVPADQKITADQQVTDQKQVATDLPLPTTTELASLDDLERYYQQLEDCLLQIGYLYSHTATSRMAKFRRLFGRAQLSSTEVAMLRGILSQIQWALQQRSSS